MQSCPSIRRQWNSVEKIYVVKPLGLVSFGTESALLGMAIPLIGNGN
jgi:hypothetical protein